MRHFFFPSCFVLKEYKFILKLLKKYIYFYILILSTNPSYSCLFYLEKLTKHNLKVEQIYISPQTCMKKRCNPDEIEWFKAINEQALTQQCDEIQVHQILNLRECLS